MIPKAPLVVVAAAILAFVVMELHTDEETTAADAELVALGWVGAGVAQEPRRDGDTWEVDIVRDDGSMVQVRLGPKLELRDFDEEFGPAGVPAHDELKGIARARAIRVAFEEIGPGRVVSVEREPGRQIEVGIRRPDGTPRRGRCSGPGCIGLSAVETTSRQGSVSRRRPVPEDRCCSPA